MPEARVRRGRARGGVRRGPAAGWPHETADPPVIFPDLADGAVLRYRATCYTETGSGRITHTIEAGAMTRLIAVHFWPALLVISRATSLT